LIDGDDAERLVGLVIEEANAGNADLLVDSKLAESDG